MVQKNQRVSTLVSMLTVRELAAYLRLSETKVYRMAKAGQIPGCQVGASWRFQRDRIDEWLAAKIDAASREAKGE